MFRRQPFNLAGLAVKTITKNAARKKAAEKTKKILKKDTAKFGLKFRKRTNPAVLISSYDSLTPDIQKGVSG